MPINRSLFPMQHYEPGHVMISGKMLSGATGAVSTITGAGVTPTRTAAGDYTLTFDTSITSVQSWSLDLLLDSDEDFTVSVLAVNDGTTNPCTVTCTVTTGATPADLDAGDFLCWMFICRNTSFIRP